MDLITRDVCYNLKSIIYQYSMDSISSIDYLSIFILFGFDIMWWVLESDIYSMYIYTHWFHIFNWLSIYIYTLWICYLVLCVRIWYLFYIYTHRFYIFYWLSIYINALWICYLVMSIITLLYIYLEISVCIKYLLSIYIHSYSLDLISRNEC